MHPARDERVSPPTTRIYFGTLYFIFGAIAGLIERVSGDGMPSAEEHHVRSAPLLFPCALHLCVSQSLCRAVYDRERPVTEAAMARSGRCSGMPRAPSMTRY